MQDWKIAKHIITRIELSILIGIIEREILLSPPKNFDLHFVLLNPVFSIIENAIELISEFFSFLL